MHIIYSNRRRWVQWNKKVYILKSWTHRQMKKENCFCVVFSCWSCIPTYFYLWINSPNSRFKCGLSLLHNYLTIYHSFKIKIFILTPLILGKRKGVRHTNIIISYILWLLHVCLTIIFKSLFLAITIYI